MMNSRLLFRSIVHVYKRDVRLFKPPSLSFVRSQTTTTTTTNAPTQLNSRTRLWLIRRYALLIGLPVMSVLTYRLSTKYETRRKHAIVVGSIGRVFR